MNKTLYPAAIDLLKELIQTPSLSGEENLTAEIIEKWFSTRNIQTYRSRNNIWAINQYFDLDKPTILLNSHHDTVQPNTAYTNNPFEAKIENGKLYGLGSNDAGGCLVSLMATFQYFYRHKDLKYNLVIAASAEEENSGQNGLKSLLPELPELSFALVGEPTEMHLAIAEKGLMVIDAYATGIAQHVAHKNAKNAITMALDDIMWIRNHKFQKVSDLLEEVQMSVTRIHAGQQHNIIPDSCHFVIDVRVNEMYTNKEIFETIDDHTNSKLEARSFHLNASSIAIEHPIIQSGIQLGRKTYGSPTLSDQCHLACPSFKIGPGKSTRSHSANEYIFLDEIQQGIDLYIRLLSKIL